jgi:hypothetical protein
LLQNTAVKVLIIETPHVHEVDGVQLDGLKPGTVREISATLASWLIAERYAVPEMRRDVGSESAEDFSGVMRETRRQDSTKGLRRRADDR